MSGRRGMEMSTKCRLENMNHQQQWENYSGLYLSDTRWKAEFIDVGDGLAQGVPVIKQIQIRCEKKEKEKKTLTVAQTLPQTQAEIENKSPWIIFSCWFNLCYNDNEKQCVTSDSDWAQINNSHSYDLRKSNNKLTCGKDPNAPGP